MLKKGDPKDHIIEAAKNLFKSKRPEGWTIKRHLEQPFINCTTEYEKRVCGSVAKLIETQGEGE